MIIENVEHRMADPEHRVRRVIGPVRVRDIMADAPLCDAIGHAETRFSDHGRTNLKVAALGGGVVGARVPREEAISSESEAVVLRTFVPHVEEPHAP